MERIRVLHVVSSLSKVNGVMSVLMNLYRKIDKSLIQFDFLICAKNDFYYQEEIEKYGGKVYYVGEPSIRKISRYFSYTNNFFKDNKDEYNIIHCHVPPLAFLFLFYARKYGIENRITHSHGTMYGDRKINMLRNFVLQIPLMAVTNTYFACSEKAGEFLFGKRMKKKIILLKNAIDSKAYKFSDHTRRALRKEFNFSNEIVIGHIGAFQPVKNHIFILDIFEELIRTSNNEYVLMLIGDGPLEKEIKEKVESRNLSSKVFFTGIRSDVPQLMQAIDILLLPSKNEGLPLVAIEAQATSLPIIMSDSITREVEITKEAQFLSIDSPKTWSEKINSIGKIHRYNAINKIIDAGYDSAVESEKLLEYYLLMSNNFKNGGKNGDEYTEKYT